MANDNEDKPDDFTPFEDSDDEVDDVAGAPQVEDASHNVSASQLEDASDDDEHFLLFKFENKESLPSKKINGAEASEKNNELEHQNVVYQQRKPASYFIEFLKNVGQENAPFNPKDYTFDGNSLEKSEISTINKPVYPTLKQSSHEIKEETSTQAHHPKNTPLSNDTSDDLIFDMEIVVTQDNQDRLDSSEDIKNSHDQAKNIDVNNSNLPHSSSTNTHQMGENKKEDTATSNDSNGVEYEKVIKLYLICYEYYKKIKDDKDVSKTVILLEGMARLSSNFIIPSIDGNNDNNNSKNLENNLKTHLTQRRVKPEELLDNFKSHLKWTPSQEPTHQEKPRKQEKTKSNLQILTERRDSAAITFLKGIASIFVAPTWFVSTKLLDKLWISQGERTVNRMREVLEENEKKSPSDASDNPESLVKKR
jgi:hypothetical protein